YFPAVVFLIGFTPLSAAEPVTGEPGTEKIPFTIERADHFFQRVDSSGAERFILQGNVVIDYSGSRIRCQTLTYFPATRHFLCLDSVRLTDPDRQVSSDTLLYYVDSAHYRALGSLRWVTSGFVGSGRQGDYFRMKEMLIVEGEAVAEDSSYRIEAEKLEYDYKNSRLLATGGIVLTDKKARSKANAASGLYERDSGITTLTGRPLLELYDDSDTLALRPYYLSCDRLRSFGSDSMIAVGRVKLWDDSLTINSDSLFHDVVNGISYFRGGLPLIDNPGYNMRGERIDVHIRQRKLDRVVAVGAGRGEFYQNGIARDDSSAGSCNWIEGDTLNVAFGSVGLDSIVSSGGARSYFREDPQAALDYVIGEKIVLVWRQGLIDRVDVKGGGRGLHLLPDSLNQMFDNPDSAGIISPVEQEK
ncbi:hypothetical protein ACFL5K_02910, partial [Gemmatimonadota bacterium]